MDLERSQTDLPADLKIALLQAHYDALAEYRKDVRRRVAHIVTIKGGPQGLALQMSQHLSWGLEKLIVAETHDDIKKFIEKAL